jgi:hypothetical protein
MNTQTWYKDFKGCDYMASGGLVCGAKWEQVSEQKFTAEPERNYQYSVYGTQGDLQCGVDYSKYVKNTFNPQFAPVNRPSMDLGLESIAPVKAMPAKLIERFQGSCGAKKTFPMDSFASTGK